MACQVRLRRSSALTHSTSSMARRTTRFARGARPSWRIAAWACWHRPAIEQIPKLPAVMWPLITIFIGGCESLRISKGWSNPDEPNHVFQKLLPEYVPGDIGFDPLGLKPSDPEEFKIMQTKELQNGRLAMIAAAGFLAQEAVTG